jgi:hypothetical protein
MPRTFSAELERTMRDLKWMPQPASMIVLLAELDDERAMSKALAEALEGLLVMADRGPMPRKLEDALTWTENDELARKRVYAALALYKEGQ